MQGATYYNREFICHEESQVQDLIAHILPLIKKHKIIYLNGDLGAGKTTFVRYLAKALQIKERITSPSFSYMKVYPKLVHIDLYNYHGDIEEFIDHFEDKIIAIEWANLHNLPFSKYVLVEASMELLDDQIVHKYKISEVY
ncbi:tRNA (adenosine(37)-N6)-threonylcarbamoyltransferase complex ATPase subunit type 1 TsaE [Mycoplasmopsis sturni]|uniref:tRNA (adenosine(37)-N6)-threonylcarbamoyltransferase complex ATPase subunit type 1 TsaE n=1 Tax=Mycoplasmopsis sturni TaxID=39047 RepID=UPI0005683F2B|nr:tRNA (adenosine(37)-N6)-threonylcarbamoyltransferase complex ATPase subunit type 1 TsaE [Mycoplasmopsis sturni]